MHVTIILDTNEREDALALALLFSGNAASRADVPVAPAPPPPVMPVEHPLADVTPSEAVLQAEADRVAGRPTGAPSGGAASPSSDSTGLPWDDRIHSTPPTQTDKGVWRKRRGVTDEVFATVSAELRAGNVSPPAVAVPAAPPVVPTTAPDASPPTPTPADTASGQVVVVAAPETPTAPPPPVETPAPPPPPVETPAAPPPPPAADGARFPTYPAFVTAMNGRPGAVYAALNTHAQTLGVAGFTALKDQPGLWDVFYDSWPVEG